MDLKGLGVGDYVYVKEGVHDASMGDSRKGLIVEHIKPRASRLPDQFLVMFPNKAFLKFHVSQLERVTPDVEE